MERYEYMRLKLADLPDDVTKYYNLESKVTSDEYVYLEFQKGMYSLPQAGILAHQLLEKGLNDEGYKKSKLTPKLLTQRVNEMGCHLCVQNSGVSLDFL